MKKIEVLLWGIRHIAENHGYTPCTEDYDLDGSVCMIGKEGNVPTTSDVRMLAEDVGIGKQCVESNWFGIEVFIPLEWMDNEGQQEYVPTGMEMWKRYGSVIGS